jgi:hypothetical protein
MELVRKLRLKAILPRLRRDEEEHAAFPDEGSETLELEAYDEQLSELEAEVDDDAPDEPRPRHRRTG